MPEFKAWTRHGTVGLRPSVLRTVLPQETLVGVVLGEVCTAQSSLLRGSGYHTSMSHIRYNGLCSSFNRSLLLIHVKLKPCFALNETMLCLVLCAMVSPQPMVH